MSKRILPKEIVFTRPSEHVVLIEIKCDDLSLDRQADTILSHVDGAWDVKSFIKIELGPDGSIRDSAVVHLSTSEE